MLGSVRNYIRVTVERANIFVIFKTRDFLHEKFKSQCYTNIIFGRFLIFVIMDKTKRFKH